MGYGDVATSALWEAGQGPAARLVPRTHLFYVLQDIVGNHWSTRHLAGLSYLVSPQSLWLFVEIGHCVLILGATLAEPEGSLYGFQGIPHPDCPFSSPASNLVSFATSLS